MTIINDKSFGLMRIHLVLWNISCLSERPVLIFLFREDCRWRSERVANGLHMFVYADVLMNFFQVKLQKSCLPDCWPCSWLVIQVMWCKHDTVEILYLYKLYSITFKSYRARGPWTTSIFQSIHICNAMTKQLCLLNEKKIIPPFWVYNVPYLLKLEYYMNVCDMFGWNRPRGSGEFS